MIRIETEDRRVPTTVEYIKNCIEELERKIHDCDYEESPDGKLLYSPNCYSYEKRLFEAEKNKLEIVLELLTCEVPFSVMEW